MVGVVKGYRQDGTYVPVKVKAEDSRIYKVDIGESLREHFEAKGQKMTEKRVDQFCKGIIGAEVELTSYGPHGLKINTDKLLP